jgi:hypothetical protein
LFVATRTQNEARVWRSTANSFERCLLLESDHPPRLAASSEGVVIAAVGNRLFNVTEVPSELLSVHGVVTALAVQHHTIFVGTTDGVYVSHAGSKAFEWSEGLPAASRIVALGAIDNAIYAITFGGAVWRRAYRY